jgi:uncharacterized protein (DUF433 family)
MLTQRQHTMAVCQGGGLYQYQSGGADGANGSLVACGCRPRRGGSGSALGAHGTLYDQETPKKSVQFDLQRGTILMNASQMPDADALLQRITIDPHICHGKPCIRGLRYPVETLLELLSAGMTVEEILADYEDLEREDILAALVFATRLSQVKRMQPMGA